ncbi:DUF1149 family protein [Streptococcus gallolyticus]|uniref:DUF1149 family protein n=1 Tax=Streptococcus hepaticus TaxID=3349163 RepID=UPI001C97AC5C|nr:DUF1149 family protein [Streptococcus gallolyticus]MBY5041883.1 DUF1149 family protein [Streptococcus gallolyticus]
MEVTRQKPLVNQYHFDLRNPAWEAENGEPKTQLKVDFQLIEKDTEENTTRIITILQFMIVLEDFVISGTMTQGVTILNRIVNEPSEFSEEERRNLALPLLDILKRMTYEVTEIALDQPGINLEF